MNGETIEVLSGEVTFNAIDWEPNDDGYDLTNLSPSQAVASLTVNNPAGYQKQAMWAAHPLSGVGVRGWLKENYTQVCLKMLQFDPGPFDSTVNLTVSDLKIPKTIDLEAAS